MHSPFRQENERGRAGVVRSTYRLQFNERFGLSEARNIVEYLSRLGISHIYASPLLAAIPHSTHGYDVCDFNQLNSELGTERDLELLADDLHRRKMGLILDIVPNHMGIGSSRNRWWWDVLACGRDSQFAGYFDIDWEAQNLRCRGKVLIPVLEDRYHRVLIKGEIRLVFEKGEFLIRYADKIFPISAETTLALLESEEGTPHRSRSSVRPVSNRLTGLRAKSCVPTGQRTSPLGTRVVSQDFIEETLKRINGSPELLNALLDWQFYRLTCWNRGDAELNYRRFFSIWTLAALRMEREDVFQQTHALPLRWFRAGWIDGFRIDHPDGLRYPARYLARLRQEAPEAWIVVEKILAKDEGLPRAWPVDGTTGYDFLNRVGGLYIDPKAEGHLDRFFRAFTGEQRDFPTLARESKRNVLKHLLSAETHRLTALLEQIAASQWQWCDFTKSEIEEAVIEMLACFPVYRIYPDAEADPSQLERGAADASVSYVRKAGAAARAARGDLDESLFELLENLLLGQVGGDRAEEFAVRFQQLAAAAMAKGVEDSAFYIFNRLVALNEVGGDPGAFWTSAAEFHSFCESAARQFPETQLATSTHDTKRGEDVRMRMAILSLIPTRWEKCVTKWSRRNERYRTGEYPDRNAEYLLYQTLVGAWPLSVPRLIAYMEKAAREAGVYTSWKMPDKEYETALRRFVRGVVNDRTFRDGLEDFLLDITEAACANSLSQVLLKMTVPGVPDFYQGAERWCLSLVDPDNRGPVDFEQLAEAMDKAERLSGADLWKQPGDGLVKMWLIRQVLKIRDDNPEAFGKNGEYQPVEVTGWQSRHAIAFARGRQYITVAPRLIGPGHRWTDAAISLPAGAWRNEFTGERFRHAVSFDQLLRDFPVALLCRTSDAT